MIKSDFTEDLPSLSIGYFNGFKKNVQPSRLEMHGEVGSMLTVNQETIQNEINAVEQQQLRNYESNKLNFNDMVLYYSISATKAISSEPVTQS